MGVTIKEVAHRANVSISTVSRVLNNSPSVSDEVRSSVLQAVKELRYVPNEAARSAAKKSNKLIGVILPDISNNIFGRILRGIDSVISPRGYNIIVCDTGGDIEKELHYCNVLKQKQVDGIIMSNALITEQHLMWFQRNRCPVVFVCQDPEPPESFTMPFGVVNINNRQAVCDMVHFLNNMGHRNIAFLSGPLFDPSAGRKRFEGYKKGLEECRISYREGLVRFCEDFTIACGYQEMKSLYEECATLPTAVLGACDNIAVGAIEFMQDNHILVPQQISVAGIDDTTLAEAIRPTLTSLRHATFEQGAKAAEMLFEFMMETGLTRLVYRMPYKILRRQSVRQLDIKPYG